jgi:hypothetical protein
MEVRDGQALNSFAVNRCTMTTAKIIKKALKPNRKTGVYEMIDKVI